MLWVPVKIKRFALFSMLCCMALSGSPVSADSVWVSELQNEVTSGQVDKIKADLISAEKSGAALFVLRIDTPGGAMEATRILVQAILDSQVPVAAYVAPAGARASSAGTYILSAAHIAAMSPATNIGSAKPVVLSFGDIDEDMKQKLEKLRTIGNNCLKIKKPRSVQVHHSTK